MKLRNKKTGETKECVVIPIDKNGYPNEYQVFEKGDSLAELIAEWEDVLEEPKDFYYIQPDGDLHWVQCKVPIDDLIKFKQIGNYFETKEEAEKAVRKLKAWKRLKDAGFEFKGWKVLDHDSPHIYFNVYRKNSDDIVPFLDLLFGGEQ